MHQQAVNKNGEIIKLLRLTLKKTDQKFTMDSHKVSAAHNEQLMKTLGWNDRLFLYLNVEFSFCLD